MDTFDNVGKAFSDERVKLSFLKTKTQVLLDVVKGRVAVKLTRQLSVSAYSL